MPNFIFPFKSQQGSFVTETWLFKLFLLLILDTLSFDNEENKFYSYLKRIQINVFMVLIYFALIWLKIHWTIIWIKNYSSTFQN